MPNENGNCTRLTIPATPSSRNTVARRLALSSPLHVPCARTAHPITVTAGTRGLTDNQTSTYVIGLPPKTRRTASGIAARNVVVLFQTTRRNSGYASSVAYGSATSAVAGGGKGSHASDIRR